MKSFPRSSHTKSFYGVCLHVLDVSNSSMDYLDWIPFQRLHSAKRKPGRVIHSPAKTRSLLACFSDQDAKTITDSTAARTLYVICHVLTKPISRSLNCDNIVYEAIEAGIQGRARLMFSSASPRCISTPNVLSFDPEKRSCWRSVWLETTTSNLFNVRSNTWSLQY